jgi:hypothetical protein
MLTSVKEDKFINVLIKSIAMFDLCVNLWCSTLYFAVIGDICLVLSLRTSKMGLFVITAQEE